MAPVSIMIHVGTDYIRTYRSQEHEVCSLLDRCPRLLTQSPREDPEAREVDKELAAQELDEDIVARDLEQHTIFSTAKKVISKFFGRDDLEAREADELAACELYEDVVGRDLGRRDLLTTVEVISKFIGNV
jgi:hypothetical protein